MTKQELILKFEEIKEDKDYLERLSAQDTPEKIQATFAEKGLDFTLDEVEFIVVSVVDGIENSEILDESSLESVTGGGVSLAVGMTIVLVMGVGGAALGWRLARKKCKPWN